MRKKRDNQSINTLIIIALLCLVVYVVFPKPPFSLDDFEKRAVWISYQDLNQLDYSSISAFEESFDEICKNSINNHCNTLIVHVRAFQDAMYKSDSFPMSKVIMGQEVAFDPLDIMISIAHKYELNFEAWINPYRISLNSYTYNQFINNSPIRKWIRSDRIIHYGEYLYILNPGNEESREYIISGVKEIVEKYDVDGIHFDDYFYVDGTYNNVSQKERLKNVNKLIKETYKTIKNIDKNIRFGISPQGNYENCLIGGADVDTWLSEEGYIDYLMPQIYWSNQYGDKGKTKLFSKRVKLWKSLKRNNSVDLYIGLALYQSGKNISIDQGWSLSSENINEQIEILYDNDIKGYSLFHYTYLLENNGMNEMENLFRNHYFE